MIQESGTRLHGDESHAPTTATYVCAVGAAAAVTIFDGVQNDKAAALMKTGGWFSRVFAGGDQGGIWFALALVFFCVFAGLMAFAYRPREAKEAFLLGASVLALLNALVKSPLEANKSASSGFLISSVFAQTEAKVEPRRASVWLFIDGPTQLKKPETKLFVFDTTTGKVVVNTNILTTTKVELPQGNYYFEIAHYGYRGIVFSAEVSSSVSVYRPQLRKVQFDSILNLFGPDSIEVKIDRKSANYLEKAMELCGFGETMAAKRELAKLGDNDIERIVADPYLSSTICANKKD